MSGNMGHLSVGHYIFDQLYLVRIERWIARCRDIHNTQQPERYAWRTKFDSHGSSCCENCFILGITYNDEDAKVKHLANLVPIHCWDDCGFAQTLDKAPESPWDQVENRKD